MTKSKYPFVDKTQRKMNNDIKVTGIVDHEDGSATVTLDLSPETYHKIFEYGFLKLITKGMDNDI
jgi:hypothetical protein